MHILGAYIFVLPLFFLCNVSSIAFCLLWCILMFSVKWLTLITYHIDTPPSVVPFLQIFDVVMKQFLSLHSIHLSFQGKSQVHIAEKLKHNLSNWYSSLLCTPRYFEDWIEHQCMNIRPNKNLSDSWGTFLHKYWRQSPS